VAPYCPDGGDLIWLDFLQAVANEQAGRRPALVLSPRVFNQLTGRCIACPITRTQFSSIDPRRNCSPCTRSAAGNSCHPLVWLTANW
jgi:mRNA-degrading endonuclease toxin of MazEF toxin-antitoxin module